MKDKVARLLYEELFSHGEVVVKNATGKKLHKQIYRDRLYSKATSKKKFSKKFYRTDSRAYYVGLDSRAASKVNGVQLFEVYILVKWTEVDTTGRTIGSSASSRTNNTGWCRRGSRAGSRTSSLTC